MRQTRSLAALLLRAVLIFTALTLVAAACSSDVGIDASNDGADAENTDGSQSEPTTEPEGTDSGTTGSNSTGSDSTGGDNTTTDDGQPATPALSIESCGTLECGTFAAPVDYRDPNGSTLQIAFNIRRADDQAQRIGYLFINPGGPGGSATELAASIEFLLPTEILERFDIVGMDPRGVGLSEPSFGCGESGEQLELLLQIGEDVDSEADEMLMAQALELCTSSMGTAAGFIGTDLVARDMDLLRRGLGEEQLNYLGYSYGSVIGAWYASLFPSHVRAMVLDGADDPVDAAPDQAARVEESLADWDAFEALLEDALDACDETCPIYNDGFPISYYGEAVKKLDLVNQEFLGDPTAGFLGVITTVYSEDSWPQLWDGLYELQENDNPAPLATLAEFQISAGEVNITEYVNCLDSWTLHPELDRATRLSDSELEDQLFEERFPILSEMDLSFTSTCDYLNEFVGPALTLPFDGGDVPILVVGNPSDPATPYTESVALADDVLSNGYLLEVNHKSHTVYPDNDCVVGIVNTVFLDNTMPEGRKVVCEREDPQQYDELFDLCVLLAEGDENATEACEAFAQRTVDQMEPDDITEAMTTGEGAAGDMLIEILLDAYDEFGVEF